MRLRHLFPVIALTVCLFGLAPLPAQQEKEAKPLDFPVDATQELFSKAERESFKQHIDQAAKKLIGAAVKQETARMQAAVVLPGRYGEDRFYVRPITKEGVELEFFTDTGGGLFIAEDVVKKLGVEPLGKGANPSMPFPEFKPEASIPSPLRSKGRIYVSKLKFGSFNKEFENGGMLGQAWFSGRVWTFDYSGKKLLWHPEGAPPPEKGSVQVSLGFKTLDSGVRSSDHPRITVEIDGAKLDMLFDTGATTNLSSAALKSLDDGRPSARATSFIAEVHFDKWRKAHPNWRMIEKADFSEGLAVPMIEVPEVIIAGHKVGPVWFIYRPNRNYHEYMSSMMDKQIEGALGGNALRHFRITVDYPNAKAYFVKP